MLANMMAGLDDIDKALIAGFVFGVIVKTGWDRFWRWVTYQT